MEFETTETARSTRSRHEKSLGLLTIKFVSLLQEAKDGVLDLKVAADSLAVKQKRRIYDITNVLEGVGLIEKKNKNIIQWRGENIGSQTEDVLEQVKVLKAQIAELEAQEKELDNQKAWVEENIKHLNHDPITSTYKFVTHEDICSAFRGETLLAVVAPAGTQLEVPLPEMGQTGQKKYQVNLRSHSAPIQVMLINRDSDSRIPVVFSVPPTTDISQIPTPPSTPASQQRFPYSNSTSNIITTTTSSSSCCCSQEYLCSDHQMVLPEHDDVLTPSATPPDMQMSPKLVYSCQSQAEIKGRAASVRASGVKIKACGSILCGDLCGDPCGDPSENVEICHSRSALEQQQMDLVDQELQSVLDVSSLLRFSTAEDHMKDDREGAVDLIDELMSANGIDYSFNLDDNEGVCDLFDVQILNY